MGNSYLMNLGFPLVAIKVFWNWIVVMVIHHECTEYHSILHFNVAKMANLNCVYFIRIKKFAQDHTAGKW